MTDKNKENKTPSDHTYHHFSEGICNLLVRARISAGRAINSILTASYWEIGRRIVEIEQKGEKRAEYGSELLHQLSLDLTQKFGRGFSERNLQQMRLFYTLWQKPQTLSAESKVKDLAEHFPLPWSGYVRLMTVEDENARRFYETEALRSGWSVRQLNRQISSKFYERTLLSRNKAEMLKKGGLLENSDIITPEEEIKDPYVLEFLGLKDEYSESDLEEALIQHLETFLLELGHDFTFVARQKRLRIGNKWYRVDLVFYHRRLRCLILIDLKIGEFSHADAGQMHLYCNYASRHWTHDQENPPVGLILCAEKDHELAKYALDGLPNKILASEYKLALPNEKELVEELIKTRRMLEDKKR